VPITVYVVSRLSVTWMRVVSGSGALFPLLNEVLREGSVEM
jgi:hypothetical protein